MSSIKDFSCIGGLEKHIKIVKEMVLFPLMYGEVYAKFNLRPPRGLLFYGPPGTGKTLIASALAVECSNAERKVSFISRKGSDCLSKYVGESERKLQKIFQLAQQTKPCIIFFDEVDGLAPVRSSRQDFVHASVVSTLLALMDGLDNNSEVIIIGATNRLDAIDPALRRPGRFDRELYFPLPCYNARKDILSVHVRNWKQKPPIKFISYLASKTIGYCGSDLQALCAEAVMCCVRRHYPQIYTSKSKYHINERSLKIEKQDFLKAQQNIVPASHRAAIVPLKCLPMKIYPLLQDTFYSILNRLQNICPVGMLASENTCHLTTSRSTSSPRIILCGLDDCHTRHLAPALLHNLEHLPCHVLDVTSLFEETGRAVEETIIQKIKTARRTLPSLLYVPDILSWWELVDETARIVFTSLMKGLDQSVHMLVLSTIYCNQANIPNEISELFDHRHGEIYEISTPGPTERLSFFQQLFLKTSSQVNDISNKSSYMDIMNIMEQRKLRSEGKKHKETVEVTEIFEPVTQKSRAEAKARTKLTNASRSPSRSNQRIVGKREHSVSGESAVLKRQRIIPGISSKCQMNITDKLAEPQIQEILGKVVESTNDWVSQQLESLFDSFSIILENSDASNVYDEMNQCLGSYLKLKKSHR